MSDLDPSERDELISAYLDGEATLTERALVRGDPDLLARAEHLAQVIALIGAPVGEPEPATRERHLAAALAESTSSPVITSLTAIKSTGGGSKATVRRDGPAWRPNIGRIASIAAVVLAIAAVPLLLLQSRDNDSDTSAVGLDEATDAGGAVESGDLATADVAENAADSLGDPADASALSTASGAVVADQSLPGEASIEATGGGERNRLVATADLGPVDDIDALLFEFVAFQSADGSASTGETVTGGADPEIPVAGGGVACETELDVLIAAGDAAFTIGTATLAGAPVVFLADVSDPGAVVVLDAVDCQVIDQR